MFFVVQREGVIRNKLKKGAKMKRYEIQIDHEESIRVERSYFEHAAGKDNIAFLMRDEEVNWKILQQYIDAVEYRYTELELLKRELSRKYEPVELKGIGYTYKFDFENERIIYISEGET